MQQHGYGLGVGIGSGAVTAVTWPGTGNGSAPVPVPVGRTRSARVSARVGSSTPLYEGGRGRPAVDLAVEIVAAARTAAEAQVGRPPAWTVVTVPPSWGAYRTELLGAALLDGLGPRVSLVSGALAATHDHLDAGRLVGPATVAVYDLGAGTLDVAVVRATPGAEIEHVGTPPAPVPWAGEDVDDALLAHVRRALAPTSPLGRNDARALRNAVVAAKEALSSDTTVQLVLPPGTCGPADGLRVTREELDELIGPGVERSVEALAEAITGAGLAADELDAVVLTGGSSRVPLVGERLSSALGRPLVVDASPELTAARGAARLALDICASESPRGAAGPGAPAHLVPSGAAGPTGRPERATRPPTAPRGSTARGSARRNAGRTTSRVLLVAALLLGLVLVVPTLSAALLSGDAQDPGTPETEAYASDTTGAAPDAGAGEAPPTGSGRDLQSDAGRGDARSPEPTTVLPAGSARTVPLRAAARPAAGPSSTAPPSTAMPSTAAGSRAGDTPALEAPATSGSAASVSAPPAAPTPPTGEAPPPTQAPPTTEAPPTQAPPGEGPPTEAPPGDAPPSETPSTQTPPPSSEAPPSPPPAPEPEPTPEPAPDPDPGPGPGPGEPQPDVAPTGASVAP